MKRNGVRNEEEKVKGKGKGKSVNWGEIGTGIRAKKERNGECYRIEQRGNGKWVKVGWERVKVFDMGRNVEELETEGRRVRKKWEGVRPLETGLRKEMWRC